MINPGFNIDNSSINTVKAKVELYDGSTLVKTCTCSDALQDFTVDRVEENGKFFGFGICQKIKATFVDLQRDLSIEKGYIIEAAFGDGTNFVYPFPTFYVDDTTRDEETNALVSIAYDALYGAGAHTVSDLALTAPYTVIGIATACADFLGLNGIKIIGVGVDESCFYTLYDGGANFGGSETIRSVLNAIAEVTQTIYYIDNDNKLVFKRLDVSGDPVYTITKNDYFSLKTGAKETIKAICNATELGDNITAGDAEGTTQYVRDNPFWELREDTATLLDNALAAVNGLSINQFICEGWIGNYLLEIGDKIALITQDDGSIVSYVLNDTVTFDGTLEQTTQWTYEPNNNETASNPTSLGEALNQTFAKVDKTNKKITLLVSEVTEELASTDSELKIIKESQTSINQTANDITLRIESIETDGVTRVETTTGFTFDEEGLRISKDNSGIENLLDNTGMYVKQDGTEVLSANEKGVKAKDLHAVTYLWIGKYSRFEDYEGGRTGCFWISE